MLLLKNIKLHYIWDVAKKGPCVYVRPHACPSSTPRSPPTGLLPSSSSPVAVLLVALVPAASLAPPHRARAWPELRCRRTLS